MTVFSFNNRVWWERGRDGQFQSTPREASEGVSQAAVGETGSVLRETQRGDDKRRTKLCRGRMTVFDTIL